MPYAPDLAGSALDGRYELHELIGEGTFGRVYRGLDRRLRRPVAIKVIKPWWGDDPDWAERFEREAQLLARVSAPGIVQIYDVGQSDEGLYYVAELVEGESLARRLRRGPLPPAAAVEVAHQLCRALAHTHSCGVIHRDIKPANVLLTPEGRVKLSDFSIARLAEGTSDSPATIAGTPKYMAPEQARGLPAGPATDLYSVGIVLYEMLAGHPPFESGAPVELALRHLSDTPPPLPEEVPRAVEAVVMRALAKAPEDRYPSASALAQALEGTGVSRRVTAAPAPSRAKPEPRDSPEPTRVAPRLGPRRNVNPSARRRAVALVSLVGGLVVAMLVGAFLIGRPTRVRVPSLIGLTRAQVISALRHDHLGAALTSRYDARIPAGRAVGQSPTARHLLDAGATVQVVLSAGPAPVRLPSLTGQSAQAAEARLAGLGLTAAATQVPAPGQTPGTVIWQSPTSGRYVPAHSSVRLHVAEAPSWRTVGSFAGTDHGASGPFTVRGSKWRVVYSMSYVGTCTFIVFCDGPTAHVRPVSGAPGANFDLSEGSGQSQTLNWGPGTYSIEITPGSDTAQWSFTIQDWY